LRITTKKPDGQVKFSGIIFRSWGGGMQVLAIIINRKHHLFDYTFYLLKPLDAKTQAAYKLLGSAAQHEEKNICTTVSTTESELKGFKSARSNITTIRHQTRQHNVALKSN
jgi:hypothetical protein